MRKIILFILLLNIVQLSNAQSASFFCNGANITVADSSVLHIRGDLDYDKQATVTDPTFVIDGDLKIEGDFVNDYEGLFDKSNGVVSFVGENESVLLGNYPLSFSHLVFNKSGHIFVETPITVHDTLELNNGVVVLKDNSLYIENQLKTSNVYCDTVMISTEGDAPLYMSLEEGRDSYYMPVGTVDQFAPVNVLSRNISSYGVDPRFAVRTINAVHPIIPNNKNYLMRYWDISNEGFSSNDFALDFEFSEGDIVGDARLFYALKMKTKNGSFWPDPYGLINGVKRIFHIDIESLGEFTAAQIGGSEFSDVIVFPNPNEGEFFIKVVNPIDTDMKYQFFDINGALIDSGITDEGVFPFDFSEYTAGTYFYKIYFGDRIVTRKIIVNQ